MDFIIDKQPMKVHAAGSRSLVLQIIPFFRAKVGNMDDPPVFGGTCEIELMAQIDKHFDSTAIKFHASRNTFYAVNPHETLFLLRCSDESCKRDEDEDAEIEDSERLAVAGANIQWYSDLLTNLYSLLKKKGTSPVEVEMAVIPTSGCLCGSMENVMKLADDVASFGIWCSSQGVSLTFRLHCTPYQFTTLRRVYNKLATAGPYAPSWRAERPHCITVLPPVVRGGEEIGVCRYKIMTCG
jgi:hypothetical protein